MWPPLDPLALRRRRRRLAAIVARPAQLRTDIDTALEARRTARAGWQERARKSARTRFTKRMEGLRTWPKVQ